MYPVDAVLIVPHRRAILILYPSDADWSRARGVSIAQNNKDKEKRG